MSSSSLQANYVKRALWLFAIVLAFRVVYAWFVPESPAGDEAYYWDWGRQLDYGYYSKPPFIAWLYAFTDWIGNGTLFGIRAMAAVLGTASALVLFFLTSALFDRKTGWIALLLAFSTPANSALSFFLTIDAPLVLLWTSSLYLLWRYLSGRGGAGVLALLFLTLGLGHLSKQMMMIFPILTLVYCALQSETRHFLKRPALLGVLFGSYLSLLPPIIWNAQNDWITFKHTSHHFEVGDVGESVILTRIGEFFTFVGTQFGVLGPAAAFLVLSLCLTGIWFIRRYDAPVRFALTFSSIPLLGMLVLAARQELQPNWPAVFYISAIALLAGWYSGKATLTRFPPFSWKKLLPVTLALGYALVAYFYIAPFVFKAAGIEGHKADPVRRMLGHKDLVERVQSIRAEQPDAEDMFIAALGHRDVVSFLAFHLPDQPERVYGWSEDGVIHSQYVLWNNPSDDGYNGKDGLVVVPHYIKLPDVFSSAFESTEILDEFEIAYGYNKKIRYSVFRCNKLKQWPVIPPPKAE